MSRAGFFAVGRDTFHQACEIGINAAGAYLVLARGSGADNVNTRWSAQAVADRMGMRRSTAAAAIDQLVKCRVLKSVKGSTRSAYALAQRGELIWLPNTLVDGAAEETAPLARVLMTQDVMVLRLLIDLYGVQNLADDGGVLITVLREAYGRTRINERGRFVLWAFNSENGTAYHGPVTAPHWEGNHLWTRLKHLRSLGLLDWIPTLFDGPQGEPIHSVAEESSIELERELASACIMAAEANRSEIDTYQHERVGGIMVPVSKDVPQVTMIGIAPPTISPPHRDDRRLVVTVEPLCDRLHPSVPRIRRHPILH